MSYRSRPADGVIKTLRELRSRYGDLEFRFSDYILARNHYEELLPILAEEEPPFRLSCEIKANQSVSRMDLLARAGFVELQPGIESFSTELLKAMDKGVRGIHNVATLKLGYLNHVVIHYNVLFGFPGEKLDWYKDMLARIPDRTEGPATEPALGGPVGVAAGPGGIVYVSDELAHRVHRVSADGVMTTFRRHRQGGLQRRRWARDGCRTEWSLWTDDRRSRERIHRRLREPCHQSCGPQRQHRHRSRNGDCRLCRRREAGHQGPTERPYSVAVDSGALYIAENASRRVR